MDFSVVRLTDYAIALETLRICWDEMAEGPIGMPDLMNEYHLACYADEDYCGFIRFSQMTTVLFECHAVILPDHREHSVEFGKRALSWMKENTGVQTWVCNIPEFNKVALRFAASLGFKRNAVIPNSYRKDGLHNMIQYLLERNETCLL